MLPGLQLDGGFQLDHLQNDLLPHSGAPRAHSSSGTLLGLHLAPADRAFAPAGGSRQQQASSREEARARGSGPSCSSIEAIPTYGPVALSLKKDRHRIC